ncbi:MAG: hypothetical protein A3I43_03530 [Omnitrophica WOR_2 bacterium RIFCSPLOWO2_02_FULL_50_19]|nr:MAG: hypothetical protein A3I43_03530 [Omnitrophica WOR_2 bacterium RIFCSPLOWO2_02_FULL_50_19]
MADKFEYKPDEIEEVLDCPWCSSQDRTPWCEIYQNFPPVKCNVCGVVFLSRRLNENGRKRFYENYVYSHETEDRLAPRLKMYEMEYKIISGILPRGKILDVGCGSGRFISKFSPDRYVRFGIEYGKEAVAKARELIGPDFIFEGGFLDTHLPEADFDLIIFRGVIEHLPNPRQVLGKACAFTKKGGHIFLTSMPNLDCICADLYKTKWTQHREFEHIVHFKKEHFRLYFQEQGFTEIIDKDLYWETPYAKPEEDILEVAETIKLKRSGINNAGKESPPFWGNVLSMVFRKN